MLEPPGHKVKELACLEKGGNCELERHFRVRPFTFGNRGLTGPKHLDRPIDYQMTRMLGYQ